MKTTTFPEAEPQLPASATQFGGCLSCHGRKTSTLGIESLTPEADIAKTERNQDSVILYHYLTGRVRPVPVSELVANWSIGSAGLGRRSSKLDLQSWS